MKNNNQIKLGRRYKTRGGWEAFIYTFINGNPEGWCKDTISGKEEPMMGTWNENTGKCIKRGDSTNEEITKPYDIIDL